MSDDGPRAVALPAGGVWLPASVCLPLWRVLRDHLERHETSGGQVRADVAQALTALRAAAYAHLSANGHIPRTSADQAPPSTVGPLITTADMATLLGCTERHARRVAAAEGIQPAARNCWRRDDVAALTRRGA